MRPVETRPRLGWYQVLASPGPRLVLGGLQLDQSPRLGWYQVLTSRKPVVWTPVDQSRAVGITDQLGDQCGPIKPVPGPVHGY